MSHRGTDCELGCLTDCPSVLWPPEDGTFYGPDWNFLWLDIKCVAVTRFRRIIGSSLDGVEHDRQCRRCHLHRRRMAPRRIAVRRSHCRGPAGSRCRSGRPVKVLAAERPMRVFAARGFSLAVGKFLTEPRYTYRGPARAPGLLPQLVHQVDRPSIDGAPGDSHETRERAVERGIANTAAFEARLMAP